MNTRKGTPKNKKVDFLTSKKRGIKNLTCFACRNMFVYLFLCLCVLACVFGMMSYSGPFGAIPPMKGAALSDVKGAQGHRGVGQFFMKGDPFFLETTL